MKKLIASFLFLIFYSSLFASEIPFFKLLQIDRENISVRARILFQDKDGFLWTGTNNGLYKYDGFQFEKLKTDTITNDQQVTAITATHNGDLIAGFNNGQLIRKTGKGITEIKTIFESPVRAIVHQGEYLWIATYGEGVFYFYKNEWHKPENQPDLFVYDLVYHPSGVLLAGTDLGLVILSVRQGKVSMKVIDEKKGLPDNMVREIYFDPSGNTWLGFQEKGICKFDPVSEKFIRIDTTDAWNHGAVNCITLLQNEYWIGTEGYGIVDYEFRGDRRIRVFDRTTGFAYTNVVDMLRDKQGNVWVATDNALLISPGEKVEITSGVDEMSFDSIRAIDSDGKGNIWFANNNGLFRYRYAGNASEKIIHYPALDNLHIVSVFCDNESNIWIGTFDNGLFRYNPDKFELRRFTEKEGLENANVISVSGDGNTVWLATLGGISSCTVNGNQISFNNYNKKEGPGNIFVYTVYIDSRKRVWFGTDGEGLTVYDKGQFRNYPEIDNGRGRIVYSITEDKSGNIWFSTPSHGIYRFDGVNFKNIGLSEGLRELNITGITTDNAGNIAVVHKRGLDLFNPLTLEPEYIGREAGIESMDADLNSISKDIHGNIWIGSQQGLIRFFNYTENIIRQPIPHIRRIFAFMKSGQDITDSVFNYNQNHLSIEYIGLWYANPEAVTYSYRLYPYNPEWITTRDRIVTFPNLPPGDYTFEVKASLNNQFKNAKTESYHFTIEKPFWKTGWFIALITLLTAGAAIFFIRERDIRLRREENLKKERVEFQFETLKSQVNPHFLFNSFNTLISIIEQDKDTAVDYVEKLSDYFRNMIQHRDRDTIKLSEELEMVDTYYYLQRKRFGENLSIEKDIPDEWLSEYSVPPLSLQLLIENAVKHNAVSHETPLLITLYATGNKTLLIRNNLNPKFKTDKSTGIGLENILNRFRILTPREVKISKSETEFIVEVPLIKTL